MGWQNGWSERRRGSTPRSVWRWWVLVGLLCAVMIACGGETDTGEVHVGMVDNVYTRDLTRIPAGGTVVFSSDGSAPHNAVAYDGSWSTEDEFGDLAMLPGDSVSMTFDEPGVYEYFCTFHSTDGEGMVATLVVGDDVDLAYAAEGDPTEPAPAEWSGETRHVPADFVTITAAVDAAGPGDLVLIEPGVYHEQVDVATPGLVIRGTDRNEVIIDGDFERPNAVNVIGVDGVAVENLTVRNTTGNGVFWSSVEGYRASYVTAVDAEVYGLYAFDSVDGMFDHSYASGSWDAGFYVGQCDPCNAVLTDLIAEWNGLGYSGTNSSGDIWIVNSVWRNNLAGIVPNTLDSELLPPVERNVIAGNLVHDQGNTGAPGHRSEWAAFGNGIIIAGGNDSLVTKNRILNSPSNGIAVIPNLDDHLWISSGNTIADNVIRGSGRADIALGGPAGADNCFEGNDVRSTDPVGLQAFQQCDGLRLPVRWSLGATTDLLGRLADVTASGFPPLDPESVPKPGPQPQMPGGADAPVNPAVDVFTQNVPDLAEISVPDTPGDVDVTQTKGPTVFGVYLATTAWSVYFGLWAYLLPFMLFGTLLALAVWDITRRVGDGDISKRGAIGWILASLVVPFVGVIAYFVVGRSGIPVWVRVVVIGGGLGAYLVLFVVGAMAGGIV